jgi:hypothetical protein
VGLPTFTNLVANGQVAPKAAICSVLGSLSATRDFQQALDPPDDATLTHADSLGLKLYDLVLQRVGSRWST